MLVRLSPDNTSSFSLLSSNSSLYCLYPFSLLSQGRISQVELRSFRFFINCFKHQRPDTLHITLHSTYKPTFHFQPMAFSTLSTSETPTLPPLRPVATPMPVRLPGIEHIHSLPNSRPSCTIPLYAPRASVPIPRKFSTSSSITNESRSPSPSPSNSSFMSPSCMSHTSTQRGQPFMRLVPTDMAHAEAVVVVPPPGPEPQKPLLLIGPALKMVNHPQRRIARGARVYPYRREMNHHHSRKASWASTNCSHS
ncbi:hypothetical protein DFH05DRAFT_971430 [Lentinula detonsa]|uniref:Uncharacterized protein n=1 Tax=Lentinula detonsa TaxID=2804962 RepID=A0A9W8P4E0_9AGAR|nr:hypothetical protein DFH05DRAFT_971430 [Lentinula detonsa]